MSDKHTPEQAHGLIKRILRETFAGRLSYYNEEQIDAGCSDRATELCEAGEKLGIVLGDVSEMKKQRDTAWEELRKIRKTIGANSEESTFDEVAAVIDRHVANGNRFDLILDELTKQRDELLAAMNSISDAFGIGSDARNSLFVIVENAKNAARRARCLSIVESKFFTSAVSDEDGEEIEDCMLNWGDEPEQYAERFGEALSVIASVKGGA